MPSIHAAMTLCCCRGVQLLCRFHCLSSVILPSLKWNKPQRAYRLLIIIQYFLPPPAWVVSRIWDALPISSSNQLSSVEFNPPLRIVLGYFSEPFPIPYQSHVISYSKNKLYIRIHWGIADAKYTELFGNCWFPSRCGRKCIAESAFLVVPSLRLNLYVVKVIGRKRVF